MHGIHCIAELSGCPATVLDDLEVVRQALEQAIARAGATLLNLVDHRFEPQGVTVLALLAESHMSIHTWPEHGYAAVDLFTCGEPGTAREACEALAALLEAAAVTIREIPRGADPATAAPPVGHHVRSTREAPPRPWT